MKAACPPPNVLVLGLQNGDAVADSGGRDCGSGRGLGNGRIAGPSRQWVPGFLVDFRVRNAAKWMRTMMVKKMLTEMCGEIGRTQSDKCLQCPSQEVRRGKKLMGREQPW